VWTIDEDAQEEANERKEDEATQKSRDELSEKRCLRDGVQNEGDDPCRKKAPNGNDQRARRCSELRTANQLE